MFVVGFVVLLYVMVGWWGDVARESEGGRYKDWEDMSFRWGMGWFIVSEVMFFGAFFGVLFYARNISVPDLGAAHSKILWPEYNAIWPTAGPYFSDKFGTIPTFGVPAINTLILLTSGATVTFAHWALKLNNRRNLIIGLALTAIAGYFVFDFTGGRIRPRLPRFGFALEYRHLRLNLLYADRFSRPPCDHRHYLPDCHFRALFGRTFQARTPLWL